MIGPKDLEDFTDEEIEVLHEIAIEDPIRVIVAGDTIAVLGAFKDGPAVRDLPVLHVNTPDPLD